MKKEIQKLHQRRSGGSVVPNTIRHYITQHKVCFHPAVLMSPSYIQPKLLGLHSNTMQMYQLLYINSIICAHKVVWIPQCTHSCTSPRTRLDLSASIRVHDNTTHVCEMVRNI